MDNSEFSANLYNLAKKHLKRYDYKEASEYLDKLSEMEIKDAEILSQIGFVHIKLDFKKRSEEEIYKLLQKTIEMNDKSPIILKNMGVFLSKSDVERAMEFFKKALKIDPNYIPALNNIGILYYNKRAFKKAMNYFSECLERDPNDISALNNSALIYIRNKEFDLAKRTLKKALQILETPFLFKNLGRIYYNEKNYDKALCYFKIVLKLDPESYSSWWYIGNIHNIKTNYLEAIDAFMESITINPNYIFNWTSLRRIDLEFIRIKNVLEFIKNKISQYPNLRKAWKLLTFFTSKDQTCKPFQFNNLNFSEFLNKFEEELTNKQLFKIKIWIAEELLWLESYDESLEYFEELLNNLDSSSTLGINIKIQIAKINFNKGNYTEAINQISNIIKSNFKINELSEEIIKFLLDMGGNLIWIKKRFELGIQYYDLALNIDPNNTRALNNIAVGYERLKNFDKAIIYLKRAYEINPKDKIVLYNLGNEYRDLKKYQEAINWHKKVIEIDSEDYYAWSRLGWEYNLINNTNKAIKCYKKAIEFDPENHWNWLNLGQISLKISNFEEANKNFNNSIRILKKKEDWNELAKAHVNIGNNFNRFGFLDKALKYYTEAIDYNTKNKTTEYNNNIKTKIAKIYAKKKNLGIALKYYKKLIENIKKEKNWSNLASVFQKVGDLFYETGDMVKGDKFYLKSSKIYNKIASMLELKLEPEALYMKIKALNCDEIIIERSGDMQNLTLINQKILNLYQEIVNLLKLRFLSKKVNQDYYKKEIEYINKLINLN